MSDQISVAFVCLGNICRSPMAEAVFKHTVKTRNLDDQFDTITSFGTAAYHVGEDPDYRSTQVCRKNGVPVSHAAQQIKSAHFSQFDYILAMDRENLRNLSRIQPKNSRAKVLLFGEYREDTQFNVIVSDPYYGGVDGFETNFRQLSHFSETFLDREIAKS
ncbi:uncharacterized protein SAPINGB_P002567 [Magnusiomyces paraingens]|uniref:Phosphotyrosine protein phosphatase I domain-containing protein n=1 Tax=Magnusiomyces paraingens TaxID=2606893 RepID=A0A5E8BEK7_9ASCO|nr:uncharacterized protein SAPINGB_P002567 [Saprochaete ingens]VVT50033.1 unnamed protein product [Saprochaete ingens]